MNPPQGQFPHSAVTQQKNVSTDQSAEMLEPRSEAAHHLLAPKEGIPMYARIYACSLSEGL